MSYTRSERLNTPVISEDYQPGRLWSFRVGGLADEQRTLSALSEERRHLSQELKLVGSSQAIKRSIRRSDIFRDAFSSSALLANRTRELPHLLRQELEQSDLDPDAIDLIVQRSREIGQEAGREIAPSDVTGDPQTAQLIFLANHEVSELATKLVDLYQEHGAERFKKLKSADITGPLGKSVPRSVDIAMFGRMTTSAAFEDVQAAVQVAHAISTHKVEQEFDYYTAVDDISKESGAGFIERPPPPTPTPSPTPDPDEGASTSSVPARSGTATPATANDTIN